MPDPQFIAAINARGQIITAWESVMVRRDFHNGVSCFEFAVAEGSQSSVQLQPGDPCTITLGGQKVITGNVCTRSVAYDKSSHQVVIAGKSLTADVADSSVPPQPGSMNNSTFEQVAGKVLQPHGISLVTRNVPDVFSTPFQYLSLQFGETGRELLNRLAVMRGVFLSDDENGNLVAQQGNPSGGSVATLQEGVNILSATGILDDQTAFGQYGFMGQSPGQDSSTPPRVYSASATNSGARPNRTTTAIAEHPVTGSQELETPLGMEVARSQWPNVQITVTVVGWFRPDGQLWQPCDNVSMTSPMIFPTPGGVAPTLGIQTVVYRQDSQNGTTTTLHLTLPTLMTSSPSYGLQDAPRGRQRRPRRIRGQHSFLERRRWHALHQRRRLDQRHRLWRLCPVPAGDARLAG